MKESILDVTKEFQEAEAHATQLQQKLTLESAKLEKLKATLGMSSSSLIAYLQLNEFVVEELKDDDLLKQGMQFMIQITIFFYIIFVSSHMYHGNPKGSRVIVGYMTIGYGIHPTLPRLNLTTFSVTSTLIPLGHSDGFLIQVTALFIALNSKF